MAFGLLLWWYQRLTYLLLRVVEKTRPAGVETEVNSVAMGYPVDVRPMELSSTSLNGIKTFSV
jgi:hypothetical protein